MWTVQVSYSLDLYEYSSLDKKIEKIVGIDGDSGVGFGYRDLFFDFDTQKEAKLVFKKLKNSLKLKGVEISIEKTG